MSGKFFLGREIYRLRRAIDGACDKGSYEAAFETLVLIDNVLAGDLSTESLEFAAHAYVPNPVDPAESDDALRPAPGVPDDNLPF